MSLPRLEPLRLAIGYFAMILRTAIGEDAILGPHCQRWQDMIADLDLVEKRTPHRNRRWRYLASLAPCLHARYLRQLSLSATHQTIHVRAILGADI